MDFDHYQREAARTGGRDLLPENRDKGLNCAALGLCGESAEVAVLCTDLAPAIHSDVWRSLIAKELGDVLWYVAHIHNVLGLPMGAPDGENDPLFNNPLFGDMDEAQRSVVGAPRENTREALRRDAFLLMVAAGQVADVVKKITHHRRPLGDMRPQLLTAVAAIHRALYEVTADAGLCLSDVAAGNVAKLRARYPDGFSPEASAAKADESA